MTSILSYIYKLATILSPNRSFNNFHDIVIVDRRMHVLCCAVTWKQLVLMIPGLITCVSLVASVLCFLLVLIF